MKEFIALKKLRERVWPLVVAQNLATDMTGASLPILHFAEKDIAHPYQVLFLLYYAVPDTEATNLPDKITRPYAWITLDLQTGKTVETQIIRTGQESNPLVGPGVAMEIFSLPDDQRRSLQELFFSRYDEAAQMYASGEVTPDQAEHLADLLDLFENLAEPPLREDYEDHGKSFLTWLRSHANSDAKS